MSVELAIALWGAIISTVLAVSKIIENQKHIKIRLTHITFCETQEMYITNVGKRPITVKEVWIRKIRTKEEMKYSDPFDARPIFPDNDEPEHNKLPKKLEEGESVNFLFSVDMDEIYDKGRFQSYVKDTSGKEYTTKEVYLYNGKHNYEEGKVTYWSSHNGKKYNKLTLFLGRLLMSRGRIRF